MISCTEFIPAYSEGFKFLENNRGRQEVEKFWRYLSDLYLTNSLSRKVAEDGLEGCNTYWAEALNEEAADFTMTLNDIKGEFIIDMHHCPSKGMLNELTYMEAYHAYCEHCEALYKPVVERYGYKYVEDGRNWDKAMCSVTISLQNR
jgi:hypothetical protein